MRKLALAIITVIFLPLGQSHLQPTRSVDQQIRENMERIEKRIVDLTAPADLFYAPEFLAIYQNPTLYTKRILTFISQADISESQKMIAAYTMQQLPLEQYITFLNDMFGLCKAGKASSRVFEIAMFPSYDWNCYFADNYKNEKVQVLLKQVKESGHARNWGRYVDDVLSGKAYRYINKYRNSGQLPACQCKIV